MLSGRALAVLAATAGAVLAVAAVAAFLVTRGDGDGSKSASEPKQALCGPEATGVASLERLTRFRPELETLDDVEAAAGFGPPDIRAAGWSFLGAQGTPPSEGATLPGSRLGGVILYYVCNETILQLIIIPEETLNPLLPTSPIEIDGREVMRVEHPAHVILQWREDGRGYSATAVPGEGFGEAEILEVIASLE